MNLSSTAGFLSMASFLVISLTPCFIFCHGACIFPSADDDVASPAWPAPRVGLGGGTAPPPARVEPSFGCRASSRRSSSKDARGLLAAIIAAPIPPRSDMRAPNRARGKPLPPVRDSSRRRLQPTNAAALAICLFSCWHFFPSVRLVVCAMKLAAVRVEKPFGESSLRPRVRRPQ